MPCGVNVIFRKAHFLEVSDFFREFGQDKHVGIINRNKRRIVAVLPFEVTHINHKHTI